MKRLLLFFFLLLISSPIIAQQQRKTDSLKAVLAKLPREGLSFAGDTVRVKALIEIGQQWMSSDTSIFFFTKALKISERLGWLNGQAIALNYYARRTKKQGNFFKADSLAFQALAIAEKINYTQQIAFSYRNLADIKMGIKKNKEAQNFYQIGIINYSKVNDKNGVLTCYNNIGLAYDYMKDYKNAHEIYNYALKLNQTYKILFYDALINNNVAVTYEHEGEYVIALQYTQKAINIYKNLGKEHDEDLATSYAELASLYYQLKNYPNALKFANLSIETNKNAYYVNLKYADNVLYKTYKDTKNYEKAFYYFERLKKREDSTNAISFEQQLSANKFQYENDKLSINIKEQDFRQKILIVGLLVFLIFVIFFWYSNFLLKKKNNTIEEQKFQIGELNIGLEKKVEERTIELKSANEELIIKNEKIISALVEGQAIERKRVAIELHDNLGAMLSGMKWRLEALNKNNLSEKEQKIYDGIHSMMHSAYSEVRLISHNMLPAELEDKGLVGAIQKLVDDITQNRKLSIHFNTDGFKDIDNKKIELELYSICMELVNNILKHAEATTINIKLSNEYNYIIFMVEDNGKGMVDVNKNGEGLKNIKSRVKTINGKLNVDTGVSKGTHFEIIVPVSN